MNRGLQMKVANVAFLSDCSEDTFRTRPVGAQLLKCIVEAHYGGTARFIQPVWVRTSLTDGTVWEGVVFIFDLIGHPEPERAYSWSIPRPNGKPRYFAVLHQGPVDSPREAVRAASASISI
jgi:hypothetical protein